MCSASIHLSGTDPTAPAAEFRAPVRVSTDRFNDPAIIPLLHTVQSLLSTNAYVHVIAFDFAKAFDTVRHETMMNKMASLELPDNIYNWLHDFFTSGHHCTRYAGQCSSGVVKLLYSKNCARLVESMKFLPWLGHTISFIFRCGGKLDLTSENRERSNTWCPLVRHF